MKVFDPNDPVEAEELKRRGIRRQKWDSFSTFMIAVAILALIVGADLLGNQWFYGDWKCAFTNCVRIQDIRNP